jgi:hypothetical protein
MQYCIARDTDQARLGERRRRLRQFDRADTMFAGLHDRVRQGRALPWQACRDRRTAACRPWPAATDSQTVTLVLDATITARVALSAIASYADEYEPECSWSWCLTITSKSSRSGRRSAVALSRCGNFPCGETSGDHLSNQFCRADRRRLLNSFSLQHRYAGDVCQKDRGVQAERPRHREKEPRMNAGRTVVRAL